MGIVKYSLGLLAIAWSMPLAAQPPAERDWGATLRQDAQALHDDIAANHPGPVNPEDPGFAARNDAQLALALRRARDAATYGDYFFALAEYVVSFDDGHMGFGAYGNTPNETEWPGFVTHYDPSGRISVIRRAEDAPVPVGAILLDCDGMTAEAYAAATLGRRWGRWQLESQRQQFGAFLFLHEPNRYVPRARTCRFDVNGEHRMIDLPWRSITMAEALEHWRSINRRAPRDFAARVLDGGMRWYAIPSFSGEPGSVAASALPLMLAVMQAERSALAAAPAIVLDLRGNGGGSSDWSRRIAEILWGRAALRRLPPGNVQVDWRVSQANLAALESAYAQRSAGSALSPEMRSWYETVIGGLRGALARGEQLWRHPDDRPADAEGQDPEEAQPSPLTGAVYFVTDSSCGSACLDAVDLWRGLGAVHVGRTTSADTLYMEVRQLRLPSGIGAVSLPMKVYRGRPRGSNQPAVPTHRFEGDIADTPALAAWIATLGRPRRH